MLPARSAEAPSDRSDSDLLAPQASVNRRREWCAESWVIQATPRLTPATELGALYAPNVTDRKEFSMKSMHPDFAAFRAKKTIAEAGEARIETRDDPGIGEIATTLDKISTSFDEYKRANEAKIDRLETRLSRPGALVPPGVTDKADAPRLVDPNTGNEIVTISVGDTDVERRCRQAGVIKPEHDEFKGLGLGEFLRAVSGQKAGELARRALSIGTDASGGHLVPSILMPGVLQAMMPESALLRAGTKMIPVEDNGAKTYTFAAVNTVPTPAWRQEAGGIAESDPTFRAVVATPRSLAVIFKISRELLADAANLDGVLFTIIAQAFAKEIDRVGLLGTGTAPEPRGIKNTASIQTVTNGANGGSLATVRYANLLSAVQAILQVDGPVPTAAIMAPRTLVGFGGLVDTTNQPLRMPEILNRVRMLSTSQLPVNLTTGTSNDTSEIFVGDFSRTSYVMRESMSIQKLNELYAGTGQIGFLAHARLDFVCEYPATLAYISGVRP